MCGRPRNRTTMNTTIADLAPGIEIDTVSTQGFTLTEDQSNALAEIHQFLMSPVDQVFVLSGYSGCGKSTLIRTLLDTLPTFMQAVKLIKPDFQELYTQLTATTNKAAENLAQITGQDASTIHSFLGLKVVTDYKTGKTTLSAKNGEIQEGYLIFIDEASNIGSALLKLILSKVRNCKIIFIGDPGQLLEVGSSSAPVFQSGFQGAHLGEVVRQAKGHPIMDLATKFRNTVETGEYFQFKPDGHHIQVLSRDDFNAKVLQEFTRPDWKYLDSKILGWTNRCVIGYNNFIREHTQGDPKFNIGDYAVCNSFLSLGKRTIKTDQMVHISAISKDVEVHGVMGNNFVLDDASTCFMPHTREAKAARIKQARAENEVWIVAEIDNTWADLRAAFAQTTNKAQGSTYGSVFIDLDDLARCTNGDTLARMLYVSISRAKHHVYLTGDLV